MSDAYTPFAPMKYDQQEVANKGWGMAASGPNDQQLIVGFYRKSILNKAKSREQGKPVHEDHDYIKIQHPGETLNIVDREAHAGDKQRWPQRWAQYAQGLQQIPDGIPISLLFPDKPSIEQTLRGYNIHTVEQLANLSGHGIGTVGMGCQEWVNAAKRYMERAEKGVSHHKFESERAEKDQQISTLTRQVAELTALVNSRNTPAPNAQTYDFQTATINQTHQSVDQPFTPPPANFHTDLSGSVEPQKQRGWPKGKPRGPRKTQENAA